MVFEEENNPVQYVKWIEATFRRERDNEQDKETTRRIENEI